MILVISPAKRQEFEKDSPHPLKETQPAYLEKAEELVEILKAKKSADLQKLMSISRELAGLNEKRFQTFSQAPTRPALFAFQGDVYQGLSAATFSRKSIEYAQQHLRILSGLYGVLRPLDQMKPHRLEMGTRLPHPGGGNLYQFWGHVITDAINLHLGKQANPVLINLASQEYFKVIDSTGLKYPVIHVEFKEMHQGEYRVIALFSKRARGKMVRFIIENALIEPQGIKEFDWDGYQFLEGQSTQDRWVFARK